MKSLSTLGGALLAALLLTGAPALAQQTTPTWQRVQRLGLASAGIRATATDAAGSTYVVGGFIGTAQFGNFTLTSPSPSSFGDGYLLKLDAQGTVLWARQVTGFREEIMAAVALDAAGNVTVAGTLQQDATFDATTTLRGATWASPDLFVARYDANGTLLWARSYGGPADNADKFDGSGVAVDAVGNIYVAGGLLGGALVGTTALNNPASRQVPVLVKLTAAGTVSWARQGQLTTTDPSTLSDPGGSAAVSADAAGNTVLCGEFKGLLNLGGAALETTSSRSEVFVARFDAAGNPVWARQSSGSDYARPTAVSFDAAGNAYVAGEHEGATAFGTLTLAPAGQTDGYIAKFDPSGAAQWVRNIGSAQVDAVQNLTVTAAGDAYVTGSFSGPITLSPGTSLAGYGSTDVLVACYNAQGNLRWAQQAGSAGPDKGYAIGVDAAGRVYVSGMSPGSASFAPLTLTGLGFPFVAQLGAEPLATPVPRPVGTLAFSPNPATETVHLGLLPVGSRVVLTDALGRTVRTQVSVVSGADTQLSVRELTPGTYLLRATDPAGRQSGGRLLVQ